MKILAIDRSGYDDGVVVKLSPDEFERLAGKRMTEVRYTTTINIVDDWLVLSRLRHGRDVALGVAEQLEAYAKLLRTETGARDVIDHAEASAKAEGGA
ncbi:MAG: hypothetical protein EKK55_00930 [Rhodocyclaceae bacterium]|nr:MAG: hypothetical protein EKK55_00930 [Rhodocyclaceae bacterium]